MSVVLRPKLHCAPKTPVSFTLLSSPHLRESFWGEVGDAYTLPLWFGLRLEDERGEPLPHIQLVVRCQAGGYASTQSDERGWAFGALPRSCAPKAERLTPQRWRVQVEPSERAVGKVVHAWFTPQHLEGSWRISNFNQKRHRLSYLLQHTLRVPHSLRATVQLRPCLMSERGSHRPVTLPTSLLATQMREEGHDFKTLSQGSRSGVRSLPFKGSGLKVGCYVLSASSKATPWTQLLESRALVWLRGGLSLTQLKVSPLEDSVEVSGVVVATREELDWDATDLAQTLSALSLSVRLSRVGVSGVTTEREAPLDHLASISPVELLDEDGQSPQRSVSWRARVPFPEAASPDASYLISLHLPQTQLTHALEQQLSQAVSPRQLSALDRLLSLASRPDLWLKLIFLWLALKALIQALKARVARVTPQAPPLTSAPPLRPTWESPRSFLGHTRGSATTDALSTGIELHLYDVDTRALITQGAPLVWLSEPDVIFHSELSLQRYPERPIEGAQVTQSAEGVSWVALDEPRCAALRQGEELWLWVNLDRYEGCVVRLFAAHLNQRLNLPLWSLRSALKRQLSALSARHQRPLAFGREALESLRAQLPTPALRRWVHSAEALLYAPGAPSAEPFLEVSWGLSEGLMRDAVSPYDARGERGASERPMVRSQRTSQRASLLGSSLLLSTLFSVGLSLPFGAAPLYAQGSHLSFRGWLHLLSESCHARPVAYRALSLQQLTQAKQVVLINPHGVPSELLDWVKSGGRLLIALEPEGASRSQSFLARLDLKVLPPSLDLTHQRATGIWWSEYALDQAHLLPFVGSTMTHFIEGPSWYQHEIAPTWVDELGRSLGYRVKVGRGSVFLFGDADALSDELLTVASNQLSALAFIEWLLNGQEDRGCPLVLLPPGHISGAASLNPQLTEDPLKSFTSSLKAWFESLVQWLQRLLGSSYGNQLIVSLFLGLWLVILSRKHLSS